MLIFIGTGKKMTADQNLIRHFYESFQKKDIKAMQNCYAIDAKFSDPVFTDLDGQGVRAMWVMLLEGGKDLRLEFNNIQTAENGVTAEWIARYTFSATGNKVVNKVKASFVIKDGKIVKHTDNFNFYNWAKQALGVPGLLLGWTPYLKNKVRNKAKANLARYEAAN